MMLMMMMMKQHTNKCHKCVTLIGFMKDDGDDDNDVDEDIKRTSVTSV